MQLHAAGAGSAISYRPDIDGLRALAVLLVIAFHAWPAVVPGGYVGVDVFFVISGYLITRLILDDIGRGCFSVAAFYVRRSKRIFPALFAVVAATATLAVFLLTPTELAQLGKSVAATAGFVSNFAFWSESGYFDTAAELKPLLHTWSLAVEEQYYVLWPLTLLMLSGRSYAKGVILVAMAGSLLVSVYLTDRHQASAFYLLPPRAWELLLGSALALRYFFLPERPWARESTTLAGLVLIAGAALLLDRESSFPGWSALFPCVGTAMVIAAGERGASATSRWLLATRPVVFIGLISYSLYLWHWPLLALARVVQRDDLTVPVATAIVATAFIAATLTWRFIETPFRKRAHGVPAIVVLSRYAALLVALLAAGLALHLSGGLRGLASNSILETERARHDVNPLSGECLRWQTVTGPLPGERCISGNDGSAPRLVVWGDSHADAVAPGLVEIATSRGYATHQLTMAGCPPLISTELRGAGADYRPCSAFNQQVLRYIQSQPLVEVVVLSARWTLYTENQRFGNDPGPVTFIVDSEDSEASVAASKRVFSRALAATVSAIRSAGPQVVILGTIPPIGVNVPECLARNQMPLSGERPCDADAVLLRGHLGFSDSEVLRVAMLLPRVCAYLPQRSLCPADRCLTVVDDDILYANDDHLTIAGAKFVVRALPVNTCLGRKAREPLLSNFQERN